MPKFRMQVEVVATAEVEVEAASKDEAARLVAGYDEAWLLAQAREQGGEIEVEVLLA